MIPNELIQAVLSYIGTDYQEPHASLDAETEYYIERASNAALEWVRSTRLAEVQWCDTHETLATEAHDDDPGCRLLDMAPPVYVEVVE